MQLFLQVLSFDLCHVNVGKRKSRPTAFPIFIYGLVCFDEIIQYIEAFPTR
jgi:hypothetical protein